ncbi:hypothetical protein BH09PLA1_BH09PLA1_15250 [soil metagenome]
MKRPRWRRRWVLLSASAALLLALVILLAPTIARPFVRARLQREVDEHLIARVEIGGISWSPPYSVSVRDVRLIATDPTGGQSFDLLSANRVAVSLASAPWRDGPIVANSIAIDSPVLHVIETRDGIVGLRAASTAPATQPAAAQNRKISELIQLRDLQLTGGRITYEDRTGPAASPMVWSDLNARIQPVDESSSNYSCKVSASDGRSGIVDADGSVDVDAKSLQLKRCDLRMTLDRQSRSVPAAIQSILNEFAAKGDVHLNLSGTVPLADPLAAALLATIEIPNATASLPGCPRPLDQLALKLTCQTVPIAIPGDPSTTRLIIKSTLDHFAARTGDASVQILGGTLAVNGAGGWGASDVQLSIDPGTDQTGLPIVVQELIQQFKISGKLNCTLSGSGPFDVNEKSLGEVDLKILVAPDNLSVQPAELPVALTDFGEISVRVTNGIATAETVRAAYGEHVFYLQTASLPLADLLKSVVTLSSMKGCVTFARHAPQYPAALNELITLAEPRGPFWFEGRARVDLKNFETSLDYDLRLKTDRGAISTLDRRIPLFNVNTDVHVTPRLIEIDRFDADVLSGKVSTVGTMSLVDNSYSAQVNLRRIDLNSLAQISVKPGEKPITVTGELSADAHLSGKGIDESALANLTGDGAVQVVRGELFRVPVFVDVARMVKLNNLATVGEAGCTFQIGEGKLILLDAAVGAPAIGVRAKGEIDLLHDFALNVNAIANPLSDWDRQVRRDNNRVANIAGSVLGTVQKGLDNVTEELLYKVHVGGTIAEPKTELIAAPILQK